MSDSNKFEDRHNPVTMPPWEVTGSAAVGSVERAALRNILRSLDIVDPVAISKLFAVLELLQEQDPGLTPLEALDDGLGHALLHLIAVKHGYVDAPSNVADITLEATDRMIAAGKRFNKNKHYYGL